MDVSRRLLALARKRRLIRPRDLRQERIPREILYRLTRQGRLVRVGRGLYTLPGQEVSSQTSVAEVAKAVPSAVICLLTALRFHDLTTQGPWQVWIAVDNKARRPRNVAWPVRVVYMSGEAFRAGIETHEIERVPVRIYSAAKTVVDCFKYRNKIGLDVAVEALRDYFRRYRGHADELWRFAKICRVTRVMRPYLEAVS
jgi:predicted transcriptional regulator of viral defense system